MFEIIQSSIMKFSVILTYGKSYRYFSDIVPNFNKGKKGLYSGLVFNYDNLY